MNSNILKNATKTRKRKPYYLVTLYFVYGDADAYSEDTIEINQGDEETLKKVLIALEMCKNIVYPDYKGIPEYDALFGFDPRDDDNEYMKIYDDYYDLEIEFDHPSLEGYPYKLDNYEVVYIDSDGDTYDVQHIFEKSELTRINDICESWN